MTGETGRCQICGTVDTLERIPLGTTPDGLTGPDPVDAKFCQSCFAKLRAHFRDQFERAVATHPNSDDSANGNPE